MSATTRIKELEEEIFTASELAGQLRQGIQSGMKPLQKKLAEDQLGHIEKRIAIARREMASIEETHGAEIFTHSLLRGHDPIHQIKPIKIFEFEEVEPEEIRPTTSHENLARHGS